MTAILSAPKLHLPAELRPGQVVAVIDTREQLPLDLTPLRTEPGTLPTGDYSVRGLEQVVSVERKRAAISLMLRLGVLDSLTLFCILVNPSKKFFNESLSRELTRWSSWRPAFRLLLFIQRRGL